jgi:hypothetical protein
MFAGIEATRYHWYVLQIAAAVARWLEPESLELRGDVLRDLDIAARPGKATLHGVVGNDLDAVFEVRRGDW